METNHDETKRDTQQELKHLGFVRVAAINTIMCLSNLYDYAKQNSGPLRSAVETVEGAVTTVVTPVYNKFKRVPDHLLVFLDEQVIFDLNLFMLFFYFTFYGCVWMIFRFLMAGFVSGDI